MVAQVGLVADHHRQPARRAHDLAQAGQVRRRSLEPRAEPLQGLRRRLADRRDLRVDRQQAAEVRREGDPPAGHVGRRRRGRERRRVDVVGEGRAVVGARQHRQHQRAVAHAPAHRAEHRERVPGRARRPHRDEARRRPEADHAAERRRCAERAAEVGALAERAHAGCQGDRRAAGRAAARERRIPRVAGLAEHVVERVGAGAELRRVGLAEDDRARRAQPLDRQRIGVGHVVGVDPRAVGGAQAGRLGEVLDPDRDAVQRARDRRVGGPPGGRQRPSRSSVTYAFRTPSTASIRSRQASSASTGDASRRRKSSTRSAASVKARSVTAPTCYVRGMPTVEVNGARLHVRQEGAGDDVLLLCGLGDDGAAWDGADAGVRRAVPRDGDRQPRRRLLQPAGRRVHGARHGRRRGRRLRRARHRAPRT